MKPNEDQRQTPPLKLTDFIQAIASKNLEESLKDANPDRIKEILEYNCKNATDRIGFIKQVKKIAKWRRLTDERMIEVEKWLNDSYNKIFKTPQFAVDCEKMFVEVGVKDSAGKLLLTSGKGGPLLAVFDVLKIKGAFVNPDKPSDPVLLDWFGAHHDIKFKEIKRITKGSPAKYYKNAIKELRDNSFPQYINYEVEFRKTLTTTRAK